MNRRKLRDDYKAKQGASYTLEGFHDSFLVLGPLLLIRPVMLGQAGELFHARKARTGRRSDDASVYRGLRRT